MGVPAIRIHRCNHDETRPEGRFVLYWMVAQRRMRFNYGLDRALEWARSLHRPLLILEPLRVDYRWASDRLHRFILDGMADNKAYAAERGLSFYPYVEATPGAGRGLLEALCEEACCVVTDSFPCFFLPRMVAAAAARISIRMERVDSNGLLPLDSVQRDFTTAYSFRRHLHKTLPAHLGATPLAEPLSGYDLGSAPVPEAIESQWPPCPDPEAVEVSDLPIDHSVAPVALAGGSSAGTDRVSSLVGDVLELYGSRYSGLSPYLHFGHVGAHQVFMAVAAAQRWTPDQLAPKPTGQRGGWWGMSESAEAFVDQLVTWRELGFVSAHRSPDTYWRFESLPSWAKKTLRDHALDPRPVIYDIETLARAQTADPVWNAAQRQLVEEGMIHSKLRMLWGKKILEWSPSPEAALDVLIALNNRYALDGRDPNSYSGILWVLGRFDRAWGPERPIYGKVRYLSSQRMLAKVPEWRERLRG